MNRNGRMKLGFDEMVGGKMAAILQADRGNKMRRVVFCPVGFLPKKGMSYWATISPIYRKGCSEFPVIFVYEEENLHIHSCELENEAGFLEVLDATMKPIENGEPAMARALREAQKKAGKEIPIAGQLKIGQRITLRVNCRKDTRTGYPAFLAEYLQYGDPLIGGEKSMRIFHATKNPGFASDQSWKCEVKIIKSSDGKNVNGHRMINVWVRPIGLANC